jgi:hypothetical protein
MTRGRLLDGRPFTMEVTILGALQCTKHPARALRPVKQNAAEFEDWILP